LLSEFISLFPKQCEFAVSEVWDSHSDENVSSGLLSCDTMWSCRWLPVFQRNMSPPSLGGSEWKSGCETFIKAENG
jgi:hypothetical protein